MPNNVIQKVYNGWNEYLVGGGATEWQEVVYLTQAEYDALPASKLTDGKIYKIKTSGTTPGTNQYVDSMIRYLSWNPIETYVCTTWTTSPSVYTIDEIDLNNGTFFYLEFASQNPKKTDNCLIAINELKNNEWNAYWIATSNNYANVVYNNWTFTVSVAVWWKAYLF